MTGREELGRLFQYDLSLTSDDNAIKADDILGQNVTIRLDLEDDKKRYFNGVVSRFAQTGTKPEPFHVSRNDPAVATGSSPAGPTAGSFKR